MTRSLQHAPFVAFSNPRLCDVIQLGDSSEWDRFGSSTKGELYWNSQVAGFGLICGPYPLQTSTITRRLMSSHLRHQGARILVLHTDHFSVRRSPCPLLFSAWPRVKVLTSPLTVDGPSKVLMPTDGSTSCISFQSSSVTLRHILSFFTLPVGGQEHTSVDHGIQLILSQMHEPFDLQRFSDLIDQETWSEERASFLALRLELLRKLFSSDAQYRRPERVTVIDMTSQLLHSTGLDGTILDMALYSFIHESDSPKMIVLSNCEQYLTHSSLNATVEALASSGSSRPASIILTTTNPTSISLPIINTLDYIMTYSHTWNNFFYDHFRIRISKGQTHVAIWAPESQICTSESLDPELRLYFGDELVYTNMDELEKSIPLDCPTEEIPVESPAINEEGILERISEQNMAIHSEESINEEEPGIIPIDGVQLEDPGEPSGIYQSATAQPVTEVSSSIRGEEGESEDPLVVVPLTKETSQTLSATQSPSLPDTLTSRRHLAPQKRCDIKDFPFSHRAVVSAMVKLTSGMTNLKVPLSGLKHSLKSEFRGAREEFLFSLITKAREEGVLMLKLEEDLVWLVDPRATKASGEDAINDNSGLIEACPLDEYPAAYQNLVITLWKMTNGSYLLRKDMGTVINSLLAEFSANYQDAGTATSLIFEAREANVVHCGKSGNMWWTSLLPPTTGIDADRRTLTDNPDAQWSLFPGPHLSPIDRPDSRSPDLIKGPAADSYANTVDSSTPAAGGTLAAPNVLSEPSDEHHKLNSTPISTDQSSLKAESASIPSVPGTPTAVLSQGLDFHRFEPITSITKTLIRDSRRAPVEYKEMALVGGKMHSVKLLVPTEKPATPAVKTPEPEPEHFALEQTTLDLPGFTEQQKAQMAYLTPRLRNEYPNLDDEALMSLVVSCMFDEEEDNEQWVERVNEPRQPLPISPYSLSSDIKLESSDADIAPDVLLITHKKLLATINQLVDGTNESQVPMSDVLLSLQAQYPDADMDVLFSFVVQAEEERVVRCERDEEGVHWISAIVREKIRPIPTVAQVTTDSDVVDPPSSLVEARILKPLSAGAKSVFEELLRQKEAQGSSSLQTEIERKLRDDGGMELGYLKDSPMKSQSLPVPATDEILAASMAERRPSPSPLWHNATGGPEQPIFARNDAERSSSKAENTATPVGPNVASPNKVDFHRFSPLISIMEKLMGGKRDALVGYKGVWRELKEARVQLRSVGWKKPEQLRDAACEQGIIKIVRVGGRMHSVKLLVSTEEQWTLATETSELDYISLKQTVSDSPGFTEEKKGLMAYLTPRLRNAYPDLDDEALMSLVMSCVLGEDEESEYWEEEVNKAKPRIRVATQRDRGAFSDVAPKRSKASKASEGHQRSTLTPLSINQSSSKAASASIPSIPSRPNRPPSEGINFHPFEPIISIMKGLTRDKGGAPVEYKAFKRELKQQKAQLCGLGWKDFHQLRDAACEQGILEITLVNGNMHSVKLLVSTEEQGSPAAKMPEFEPLTRKHTTFSLPGFTDEQKMYMAYLIPRMGNEYLDMDNEALMSFVASCVLNEDNDKPWVEQVYEAKQRVRMILQDADQVPQVLPRGDFSDGAPKPPEASIVPGAPSLTDETLLATVHKLDNGSEGSRVRKTDVLFTLQMQYPDANVVRLFAFVSKAEKKGLVCCERDEQGAEWLSVVLGMDPVSMTAQATNVAEPSSSPVNAGRVEPLLA